jgi:hypothetical protein
MHDRTEREQTLTLSQRTRNAGKASGRLYLKGLTAVSMRFSSQKWLKKRMDIAVTVYGTSISHRSPPRRRGLSTNGSGLMEVPLS